MRVCFVNSLYAPNGLGGAEYTVRYLAEGLVARGHQVSVVSLAPDGRTGSSVLNGVRTQYVPLMNVYWPFWQERDRPPAWKRALWHLVEAYNPVMISRLSRLIARDRPDVISCHNMLGFSVGAWVAARRQGIPLVQTLHDYFMACPGATMCRQGVNCAASCTSCRLFSASRRRLSNLPDAVTSVSGRTLHRLESAGFFRNVRNKTVIFGSNAPAPVHRPRPDRAKATGLRLGFLGRIEAIKGLDVAVRALTRLPPGAASLVIGGRCPDDERARLIDLAAGADVRFLGYVQPDDFFPQIDALVVPSLWEEPLGRVIHEAMAFGVPSIASRIGGIPEIVVDGETGYLFEAGNVDALAAVIRRIVDDGLPAARLGEACRERSRDFAPDVIFDQYFAAFSRAAAG